jgi:mono/diheme cytochrome c family protein
MAKSRLLFMLSGFLVIITGCASRPLSVQEKNYPADKVDARGLFQENCIVCHGENGRAHTFHGWLVGAQNLTDPEWQQETTDDQVRHAITTGPSVMPAFGKRLSPTEIQALAGYVRSFNEKK